MKKILYALLMICAFTAPANAESLTIPATFVNGETLTAASLNNNMAAVKGAVDDNDARIAALEATIATLQTQLTALQNNSVLALDGNLEYVVDDNGYATARFTGVNVQVVNGLGQGMLNGLGNLIVGYNLPTNIPQTPEVCSKGEFADQMECESNNGVWSRNHKTGSHNLVAGNRNSYASHSGVVFGEYNIINRPGANVTGGIANVASGMRATVSAGYANTASGDRSAISGGWAGTASGTISSISGGESNIAAGQMSSIVGGIQNKIEGNDTGGDRWGSILGGALQTIPVSDYQTIPPLN